MIPILVDLVQLLHHPSVVYVKITKQKGRQSNFPYEHQMQTPSLCGQYPVKDLKQNAQKQLK
jgi:hypothetical protein